MCFGVRDPGADGAAAGVWVVWVEEVSCVFVCVCVCVCACACEMNYLYLISVVCCD